MIKFISIKKILRNKLKCKNREIKAFRLRLEGMYTHSKHKTILKIWVDMGLLLRTDSTNIYTAAVDRSEEGLHLLTKDLTVIWLELMVTNLINQILGGRDSKEELVEMKFIQVHRSMEKLTLNSELETNVIKIYL